MSACKHLQVKRLEIIGAAGQNPVFVEKPEFIALSAKIDDGAVLRAEHKNGRIAAAAQHATADRANQQVIVA